MEKSAKELIHGQEFEIVESGKMSETKEIYSCDGDLLFVLSL